MWCAVRANAVSCSTAGRLVISIFFFAIALEMSCSYVGDGIPAPAVREQAHLATRRHRSHLQLDLMVIAFVPVRLRARRAR